MVHCVQTQTIKCWVRELNQSTTLRVSLSVCVCVYVRERPKVLVQCGCSQCPVTWCGHRHSPTESNCIKILLTAKSNSTTTRMYKSLQMYLLVTRHQMTDFQICNKCYAIVVVWVFVNILLNSNWKVYLEKHLLIDGTSKSGSKSNFS